MKEKCTYFGGKHWNKTYHQKMIGGTPQWETFSIQYQNGIVTDDKEKLMAYFQTIREFAEVFPNQIMPLQHIQQSILC